MNGTKNRCLWCLPFLACLTASCTVGGKVTDIRDKSTVVRWLRVEGTRTLKVLDGDAPRRVPLARIRTMRIYGDMSRTYDRDLYYLAEIVFSDGTKIGSTGHSNDRRATAYVAVGDVLQGRTKAGDFEISLHDVSRLEIVLK